MIICKVRCPEYWGPYTGRHDKLVLSGDPQNDVLKGHLTRWDDASDIANVTTDMVGVRATTARKQTKKMTAAKMTTVATMAPT